MAGNEVTLTFAGDSTDLEKAFSKVGTAAKGMADDVDSAGREVARASKSFDDLEDSAGTLDTRAMGFRDSITGVQDTMSGWSQLMKGDVAGGLLTLGMGIGDLASAAENLIFPIISSGTTWVTTHASMAASSIATAASAVASWISMAAASVANAAVIAASWLLAFLPVIIVGALVIGLVVLIVKNWDKIKAVIQAGWNFVKNITSATWNWIKSTVSGAISGVTSFISSGVSKVRSLFSSMRSAIASIMSGVANVITSPFRMAFQGIRDLWNRTLGGKGISFGGSWGIPKVSFTIPKLAEGGIILPRPGGTMFIGGEAGQAEAVIPLDRLGDMGGGRTVIELRSGGTRLDDMLLEILRKAIRNQGGGSVVVLG